MAATNLSDEKPSRQIEKQLTEGTVSRAQWKTRTYIGRVMQVLEISEVAKTWTTLFTYTLCRGVVRAEDYAYHEPLALAVKVPSYNLRVHTFRRSLL